ncbi:uncharacterized protein LOC120430329 [Culex pipiens pallens]|uniref:uncharacterized protein LOC120430329 n=1 Tax=Culex pipiens pallens TaxID=42434 RepID=UPI0019536E7C|nr:uncharacterized protein LOC120430329 [Culex pipiens pallens]
MVYSSRENFTATMLGGGGSGLEYGGDSRMSALVDETVVSDWQISSGQLPPAPVWGSSGPPIPPVVAPPVVNSPNLDDLTEEQVSRGQSTTVRTLKTHHHQAELPFVCKPEKGGQEYN